MEKIRQFKFMVLAFVFTSLIANCTTVAVNTVSSKYLDAPAFELRCGLNNSCIKFLNEKKGRVAFLGGSITAMDGWRNLTAKYLESKFPETKFDFVNAGLGGTNSTLGVCRLQQEAFINGKVDLLFVEFAVNDSSSPQDIRVLAMEGIIRQARRLNPDIDIVIQYFITKDRVCEINKGHYPDVIADHDKSAMYYNIPVIHQAAEITRQINAGKFTWEQFSFDACHPLPYGHQRYAEIISAFLGAAWTSPKTIKPVKDNLPSPLNDKCFEYGTLIAPQYAKIKSGWQIKNPSGVELLEAVSPASELEVEFQGSLFGLYAIVDKDACILDVSIDGNEPSGIDMFDSACLKRARRIGRTISDNLSSGTHKAIIRLSEKKNEKSSGHKMQIISFMANQR